MVGSSMYFKYIYIYIVIKHVKSLPSTACIFAPHPPQTREHHSVLTSLLLRLSA